MSNASISLVPQKPWIVGSFGSLQDLIDAPLEEVIEQCDVVEIRLDILRADGWAMTQKPWFHLKKLSLLFTARCRAEGGVRDDDAEARQQMVAAVIDDASMIDIELASAEEMQASLRLCQEKGVPWVASYHQFHKLPSRAELCARRELARQQGAAVFKVAAMLHSEAEISELEAFQSELVDFPVSSMGMGPLAPESRVRCALAGSVLNYGFIGKAATAPGQWPAGKLRGEVRGKL